MRNKPHIIFIVLDTLRADKTFSTYSSIELTPFLKKLLKNSLNFRNCIANTVWTFPSHCSMFTGLNHSQIREISNFNSLGYKIPTATQILKNDGYKTYCYTENSYVSKIFQLTKGFEHILNNFKKGFIWLKRNIKLNYLFNLLNYFENIIKDHIYSKKLKVFWKIIRKKINALIFNFSLKFFWKFNIYNFENLSIQEINKFSNLIQKPSKDESYFIFFNIMATHEPYNPPKQILKLFNLTNKKLEIYKDLAFNAHEFKVYMNQISKKFNKNYPSTIEAFYNASVYYSDLILKWIFYILKKKNLLTNSYIIITSDHGELLGNNQDHFLWGHSMPLKSVHKSLTHVPLLIYHENFKRKDIEKQVQLKDLFHTILNMASIPENRYELFAPEKSLINQVEKNQTPQYIFGEYLKSDKFINDILLIKSHKLGQLIKNHLDFKMENDIWFLRSNKYKYINYANRFEEFFDILNDPYEKNNIFDENNEKCKKFRRYLKNYLKQNKDVESIKKIITKSEKDKISEAISSKFKNIEFKV